MRRSSAIVLRRAAAFFLNETLISHRNAIRQPPPPPLKSFLKSTISTNFEFSMALLHRRTFSSSSDPSTIVLISSEEQFNSSLSKAQGRFISPVIAELSKKYPHVTTYKIDIDQDGLQSTLAKLNITSVPTLHFFQNGKKAAEVIGADVVRLKDTMEKLYKQD